MNNRQMKKIIKKCGYWKPLSPYGYAFCVRGHGVMTGRQFKKVFDLIKKLDFYTDSIQTVSSPSTMGGTIHLTTELGNIKIQAFNTTGRIK